MHIVYLEPVAADVEEIVRSCLPPDYTLQVRQPNESPVTAVKDADFILVATTPVTAEVIQAAPKLKLIQHQGVGYNNIDLTAAREAEVPVALTSTGSISPVAEHVFMLVMSLYRHLFVARQSLRDGQWLQWGLRPVSYNVAGKTLGIIGLGRIGKKVAVRAKAFECETLYYDIVRPEPALEAELGVKFVDLETLLSQADIVTLHVPLDGSTRNMIGAQELALMQSHALLINAARGGVVDEVALLEALHAKQIAGAGLDVFVQEPPAADNPLLLMENVVATPHIAAGTRDALTEKMTAAFANMQRVERGHMPEEVVA